jgi:hypothetical protein
MTAVAVARAQRDTRTFDRVTAAILMPIGPAAVAVLRFVIPPSIEQSLAHPEVQRLVVALSFVGVLTLVPGAYAAIAFVRRYQPVLSTWVAALLIPGYLALGANAFGDAIPVAASDLGLPAAGVIDLIEAASALPTVSALFGIFVVGHIVGTILLGIAVIRARVVPLVIGVLLAVSQPLHLTAVMSALPWLDLIAWGLTALGMGFLGWRLLRTPNDEWELPPIR